MTGAALIPVASPPVVVTPVVLAAHGSRDPRSARTMRHLAAAVSARWGGPAEAAFLDFNTPTIPAVLRAAVAGGAAPVVVPALLTSAYHRRVDLPEVLRSTGLVTPVTGVLGPAWPGDPPDPLLLDALVRRLGDLAGGSDVEDLCDGLVLIAAGTSDVAARSTVEKVAVGVGERLDVACRVGYASGSPTAGEVVAALRALGARRVAAASYFLAAGRLHDAAAASARAAGALAVAAPLGAAAELVELIVERVRAVTSR